MKEEKKPKGQKVAIIVLIAVIVTILSGLLIFKAVALYGIVRVEVLTEVYATDYLKTNKVGASFVNPKEFDLTKPGTYKVHLKVGYLRYSVKLIVEDTIPPEFELKETSVGCGEDVKAADLVDSFKDSTDLTFTYVNQPDFSVLGEQEITICATDLGGNKVEKTVVVLVTPVVNKLVFEAGSTFPEATVFLSSNYKKTEASFVLPEGFVTEDVMKHVGKTELSVLVEGTEYKTNIEIIDTVSPVIKGKNYSSYTLLTIDPKNLIASCEDKTDVTYTFEKEPSKTTLGTQDLVVIATDEGGNTSKVNVKLTLQKDTEPPVIKGANDITVNVGNTVAYRKMITVSDNSGASNVSLNINSSQVNLNAVGTYTVYCTATDKAGNKTSASFTVSVKERTYSQEELDALCDKILAKIITSGMSQRQKADAIWHYVRSNLSFVNTSEKCGWVKAAILAIEKKKGDCYTYACLSKALLTRAGIKNADIHRIPKDAGVHSNHYWNLVDVDGTGWYHFDTCPRRNAPERIILWTDSQLMAYSAKHDNSHNYDHSQYTNIKE